LKVASPPMLGGGTPIRNPVPISTNIANIITQCHSRTGASHT